jgi:hypothetical protein
MKRIGNLWPQVTSFGNLLGAAEAAAKGKRKRPDVAAFLLGMEWELLALQRELTSGDYQKRHLRAMTALKDTGITEERARVLVLERASKATP